MGDQHTYRVIVRGAWRELSDPARARLRAEADEHGLLQMRFTEAGSLTYDTALQHFSYRFVVVADAAEGEELAALIAEERAEADLRRQGLSHDGLRSSVTDMDTMRINRPSRR
jgi:hypothetical protein